MTIKSKAVLAIKMKQNHCKPCVIVGTCSGKTDIVLVTKLRPRVLLMKSITRYVKLNMTPQKVPNLILSIKELILSLPI